MAQFCYDDVPVLETTGGKLKGYFYNGEYIFKGVPYAYADTFPEFAYFSPNGERSRYPSIFSR